MKILRYLSLIFVAILLSACAKAPLDSEAKDIEVKRFTTPPKEQSGLYIYRDSYFGGGLKKTLYVDDKFIGESAPKVFFYKKVLAGRHKISTESEFSNNDLWLDTQGGQNYFIRQYIKPGVLVGGANLEVIPEDKAQKVIRKLKLAITY